MATGPWDFEPDRRRQKRPRFRRGVLVRYAVHAAGVLAVAIVAYAFVFPAKPKPPQLPVIVISPRPMPPLTLQSGPLSPSAVTVIDGDTIAVGGRTVRLVGFDTPERGGGARCRAERDLAERATARLRGIVKSGGLALRHVPCACRPGTQGTQACNYGRACGYLYSHGRDVGPMLISERLARSYRCGATSCPPRQSWC